MSEEFQFNLKDRLSDLSEIQDTFQRNVHRLNSTIDDLMRRGKNIPESMLKLGSELLRICQQFSLDIQDYESDINQDFLNSELEHWTPEDFSEEFAHISVQINQIAKHFRLVQSLITWLHQI